MLGPGGCTAFRSHSSRNVLIHPAREQVAALGSGLGLVGLLVFSMVVVLPTLLVCVLEPVGCTAFRSRSNANRPIHPARGQVSPEGWWLFSWKQAARVATRPRLPAFAAPGTLLRLRGSQLVRLVDPLSLRSVLEPGGATAFRGVSNDNILIHPAREQNRFPVPGTASGTNSSRDGQLRAASRGGQAFGTSGVAAI